VPVEVPFSPLVAAQPGLDVEALIETAVTPRTAAIYVCSPNNPDGLVFDERVLRAIANVDPFTYAVHGFKAILLKDGGFTAIYPDLLFLFAFGIGTLLIATPLFKRTL